MCTTRKVSQELLNQTIQTARSKLQTITANHSNGSSTVTPLIKRRNSLSTINQNFMLYDADLVGNPSAKGFRLITGDVLSGANFRTFCEDVVFNRNFPAGKIITFGNINHPEQEAFYHYATKEDAAEDKLIRNATITVTNGTETRDIEVTTIVQESLDYLGLQKEQLVILKKLYVESLNQNTFIFGTLSCQLILVFEMLRNFNRIFASDNAEVNADAIQQLVIGLRKDRHVLDFSTEAIEHAIKGARLLTQGLVGAEIESPNPLLLKPVRSSSEGNAYGKFGFAKASAAKDEGSDLEFNGQGKNFSYQS